MLHILRSIKIKCKHMKYTTLFHRIIKTIRSSPLPPPCTFKKADKIRNLKKNYSSVNLFFLSGNSLNCKKKKANMVDTRQQMRLDTFQSSPDATSGCLGIDPSCLKNTALRKSSGTRAANFGPVPSIPSVT